jgi:hypothetical protein
MQKSSVNKIFVVYKSQIMIIKIIYTKQWKLKSILNKE